MGFLWQKPAADADLISKTHVDIVQQRHQKHDHEIDGLRQVVFFTRIRYYQAYFFWHYEHTHKSSASCGQYQSQVNIVVTDRNVSDTKLHTPNSF